MIVTHVILCIIISMTYTITCCSDSNSITCYLKFVLNVTVKCIYVFHFYCTNRLNTKSDNNPDYGLMQKNWIELVMRRWIHFYVD